MTPIGDPCELRATWAGEPPDVGDYLSSGARARFAYAILGVVQIAPGKLKLEVIRLAPADVPDGARVHAWKWNAR